LRLPSTRNIALQWHEKLHRGNSRPLSETALMQGNKYLP